MTPQTSRQSESSESLMSSQALLEQLDDAVQKIIDSVAQFENPESVHVDEWTVKDTLGHVTFWHESFARIVRALVEGRQPDVWSGRYKDLNWRGVEESRVLSTSQIVERLTNAHDTVRKCVLLLPADTRIPYRKDSRDYSPSEHLEVVRKHFLAHRQRIERARRRHRSAEMGSL